MPDSTSYKMSTAVLKKRLDETLETILPLFEVTRTERNAFQKYTIRRCLDEDEGKGCSKALPFYNNRHIYFYFPSSSNYDLAFHEVALRHEMSHYIHNMIDGRRKIWPEADEKSKPLVMAYTDLKELVADYPNYIIGDYMDVKNSYYIGFYNELSGRLKSLGPNFLPTLVRMTLKEALDRGIVETG